MYYPPAMIILWPILTYPKYLFGILAMFSGIYTSNDDPFLFYVSYSFITNLSLINFNVFNSNLLSDYMIFGSIERETFDEVESC